MFPKKKHLMLCGRGTVSHDTWNDTYTICDTVNGGLECAYFVLKRPTINSVSVGPQVDGAHSIDESLDVTTVKPLLKAIVNTLQHIGEIK